MGSYRKGNQKKERIVMLVSSVFVLAALTMTGIYMQSEKKENADDGYTLDLTKDSDNAGRTTSEKTESDQGELDYMPLEAGSDRIKLPGLTHVVGEKDPRLERKTLLQTEESQSPEARVEESQPTESQPTESQPEETMGSQAVLREMHFSEADGLLRPVAGQILLPFSMEKRVYFQTLDQYRYHPAVLLQATEGETVMVSAPGQVVSVFQDSQLGTCVTVDLGDGYLMTYGQLKDLQATEGSYLESGMPLAVVAAPTRYYSKEGAHLYLQIKKDDVPISPEELFR